MDNAGTYDHVYFVFLDAAGHSDIVAGNPWDRAAEAFDLLRERVDRRLATVAASRQCSAAVTWQWAGDGGLLVVQDDRESVAAATALGVARGLLELDLHHLRDEFAQLAIRGELHLRVSVHKGTLRYRGPGHEGSIG